MESITFKTVLSNFDDSPLWGGHIIVPEEIARIMCSSDHRRVKCIFNGLVTLHCALMPNKGSWFILMNKDVIKKLGISMMSELSVHITKDDSEYGMPMSDEFREVLDQDTDFYTYFHKLTPGKQRSLIYMVNKYKSIEVRIKKTLAIADHLVTNKGLIDYKLLNEAFKRYNEM